MSKDSLVKGTIILALAALIARFLGVVQRVPLKALLDDSGMATYGIANNIYLLLLIVATAGIPSALSKLIAERTALGLHAEAQRIYRAAVMFALAAGLVITSLLYFAAPYYAVYVSRDADATWAIRAIAPALLLFPLIAIMRGYFQGRQMMTAGGLSQIVEQILRVATAIALAVLLLWLGYGKVWAVAGASFGGVLGSVGAFFVMLYFWRKLKKSDRQETANAKGDGPTTAKSNGSAIAHNKVAAVDLNIGNAAVLTYKQIYAMIFRLSIPISLISLAVPLIYFIDSSTVIALLEGPIGNEAAKEALGILTGRAQSLAGIPPILAIALSQSVVPVISSAYARRDYAELSRQASLAMRLALLSGLPLVVVLAVAARPINGLLFFDTDGTAMIALLTVSSMFQITMMTSAAILMGLGKMRQPLLGVFVGILVKLAGTFLLSPIWGIYGIIVATMLCFIVTTQLNLWALRQTVELHILGRRWKGVSLTVLLTAGVGGALEWLGYLWIHPFGMWLNFAMQSVLLCLLLFPLYFVLLAVTRGVVEEDWRGFPVRMQKWLRHLEQPLRRIQKWIGRRDRPVRKRDSL